MNQRVAVYPGSFDPLTNGHMDIIQRSLKCFDTVVVGVAVNPAKVPLFSEEERVEQIQTALEHHPRVEVLCFQGLLVNFAREVGAQVVVRGLRAVSDFEYEFQMAHMNTHLAPDLETLFMMTGADHFYVSSRLVKEVGRLGGETRRFLPPNVYSALLAKLGLKEGE